MALVLGWRHKRLCIDVYEDLLRCKFVCNVRLTNKFHIALHFFSNRPQMTSKCGKNILTFSVIYYWTDARQHGIYLFHIIKKQLTTEKAFLIQNLSTWLESRPLPIPPTLTDTIKAIWCNLLSQWYKWSNLTGCYA